MPSALSLNLRRFEIKALDELFAMEGFKVNFALRYTELANPSNIPEWILEIIDFLDAKKRQKPRPKK